MIRKSISCALATLLTVIPALALLLTLLGYRTPGSEVVVLVLIFCFAVGAVWLGSEVSGNSLGWTTTKFAVAILLALTSSASAAERADKILSGCKIMFGILAENKDPPADTIMGGGDATFCLGVVQGFVNVCQPTGVPFQNLDMATFNQMLHLVIVYIEARPERQHEDFVPLAFEALRSALPCKR